ncbi:MAG: peptide deformylase [Candidatus Woykebacteria bacterium]
MTFLKVIRLGHPKLRSKSKQVSKKELSSKTFQKFLDDLAETCLKYNGAGIAAPQVGVNKRVIVVHVDPKNPRYPNKKPFPLSIVINPKIVKRSSKITDDWEGDLSAGIIGLVPRPNACTVVGLDRKGKEVTFKLTYGFHAKVFQHEIDHLNGVFFIDRVKKNNTISELAEWEKYWKDKKI